MKTSAVLLLFSVLVLSFISDEAEHIEPRNFLDDQITDLLNSTFQDLKNITIPEAAFKIDRQGVNISFSASSLKIFNLESIEVEKLETSIIPLKVKNITLKLNFINITADEYDLSGVITSGSLQGPVELFGKGKARIDLENMYLTAGIDFTSFNNTLMIKPKGIHDFDFYLRQANFGFENLLGDPEMGEVINVFLSYFLPYVIADFEQEFFDTYQDQIIYILNEILKDVHFP